MLLKGADQQALYRLRQARSVEFNGQKKPPDELSRNLPLDGYQSSLRFPEGLLLR